MTNLQQSGSMVSVWFCSAVGWIVHIAGPSDSPVCSHFIEGRVLYSSVPSHKHNGCLLTVGVPSTATTSYYSITSALPQREPFDIYPNSEFWPLVLSELVLTASHHYIGLSEWFLTSHHSMNHSQTVHFRRLLLFWRPFYLYSWELTASLAMSRNVSQSSLVVSPNLANGYMVAHPFLKATFPF